MEIHANAICVERPNETRETQETKEAMETYHGDYIIHCIKVH